MQIKKTLFNKSTLYESTNYLTDTFILFNKVNPNDLKFPVFKEKIKKYTDKQMGTIIPKTKEGLTNINNIIRSEYPLYQYSNYSNAKAVKLEGINCKLNLKYYDFIKDVFHSKINIDVFINKGITLSPVYIFYRGTNKIMAIFMPMS